MNDSLAGKAEFEKAVDEAIAYKEALSRLSWWQFRSYLRLRRALKERLLFICDEAFVPEAVEELGVDLCYDYVMDSAQEIKGLSIHLN